MTPTGHLNAYRRHLASCEHRPKGQHYTLCDCPVWAYGQINGKPFRQSLNTNDWPRAQRRIEILLSGNPDAVMPSPTGQTVSAAVTAYLSDCEARNLAQGTIRSYGGVFRRLCKHCGQLPVERLTVETLLAYRDSRRALKPRTQRKELKCLRAFCAYCMLRKQLAENPAKRLKPPQVEDVPTLPFEGAEVTRLLDACDRIEDPFIRQRDRALVLVLLYSGLRVGDVATLERSRLESTGHLVLRTTKTHVPVKIHLHKDAADALRALPAP